MVEEVNATLSRDGEVVTSTTFRRSHRGLYVNVRAVKPIEDLMRGWGGGERLPVQHYGRGWSSDAQDLMVWTLPENNNLGNIPFSLGTYSLSHPCMDIVERNRMGGGALGNDNRVYQAVNLAFLRFCGISEEGGVNFSVRGVHTLAAVRNMRDLVEQASRQFYIDFLQPCKLTVKVVTMSKEWEKGE